MATHHRLAGARPLQVTERLFDAEARLFEVHAAHREKALRRTEGHVRHREVTARHRKGHDVRFEGPRAHREAARDHLRGPATRYERPRITGRGWALIGGGGMPESCGASITRLGWEPKARLG